MNENNELKRILEEILEHTKDADANRAQHFHEFEYFSKKDRCLRMFQFFLLLFIVLAALVSYEIEFSNSIILMVVAVSSVLATALEISSLFLKFDEVAQAHWKAAQSYVRLYRECQFFYTNYSFLPMNTLREKAWNISNELNTIALLSPDLRKKNMERNRKGLGNQELSNHRSDKQYRIYGYRNY